MKNITRRTALLGCTGIASILPSLPTATAADEPVANKREFIVVGPFKLGEWFDSSEQKIKGIENQGAPERKAIVQSFNDCLLYIIDERIWLDQKNWAFAKSKGGEPKLAAVGKLYYSWENNGDKFAIQITESSLIVSEINYDDSPPTQAVAVHITINTMGSTALAKTSSTIAFGPKADIKYDINGKLLKEN